MSASRRLSSLGLFALFVACAPTAPAGGVVDATSHAPEPVSPDLVNPPLPARNGVEKSTPPAVEALPELCPLSMPGCSLLKPATDALSEGDPARALELLAALPGVSEPYAMGARYVLEGRGFLESESLAYGAGGKGAVRALELFEQALPLVSDQAPVVLERARARLSLGRGDEALSDLRMLAARYPETAEIQAALGVAYLSTGRAARALEPLRQAVALDPQEPERLIVLGTAHMLLGDLVEAERRFRGAVSLDSSSARAHGDLGAVLLVQGKIPSGKAHLLQAARLDPTRATYVSNLSYAELLDGDAKAAEDLAQKAIKLDSKLASAWLNLGLAQVELGRSRDARASFEEARTLDPTDPRPQNNLADLDELERKPSTGGGPGR